MDNGLVHKIAVLCKDYYVNRTIDDLFIFAGAAHEWWTDCETGHGSMRMDNVYGWIEGISKNAPNQLDRVISGVAIQIAENESIPEGDRRFLKQKVSGSSNFTLPNTVGVATSFPDSIERLLETLVHGLPRAMLPLKYRREGSTIIDFSNEYDVQSLLHALMRPWIRDIRPEEYTPSYAGTSTRIDFLLPTHEIVLEVKYIRDKRHARTVGNELIVDISHYMIHPQCSKLWIVAFDPGGYILNPDGLKNDLDGMHESNGKQIVVKSFWLTS